MHGTEKNEYHVNFGTNESYVSCSCPWYRRNRSLCKHFFAVIKSGYKQFEDLTLLYKNHPLHVIDEYLLKSENDPERKVSNFKIKFGIFGQ